MRYFHQSTARRFILSPCLGRLLSCFLLLIGAPLSGQVFQDAFARSNSALLGSPWEILKGTSLKIQDGRAEAAQAVQSEDAMVLAGFQRRQQTIEADWTPTTVTGCSGVDGQLLLRVQDANNYYAARVAQGVFTDAVRLYKLKEGIYTELASLDVSRATSYPFHLKFEAINGSLEFRVVRPGTQELVVTAVDTDFQSGSAGLLAFAFGGSCAPEARSTYDNFVVSSQDERPFIHPIEPWLISGYSFGADWEEESCFTELKCDPQAPRRYRHAGVDVSGSAGQPVIASRTGRVAFVVKKLAPGLGGAVVLEHDMDGIPTSTFDRTTTLYLHVTPQVQEGSNVVQGDVIGTISDIPSPHLHFGLRKGSFCESEINDYLRGALPPEGTMGCAPCFGMPDALPQFPEDWQDPNALF